MKTETTNLTRPANLISLLPTDLRAWLPAAELARAARDAAETFYWLEADEEDHTPFGGCACPLRKLAALTYCYAAGTLADNLVALEMVEDPALRSLTGDAVFAPDKLRLFRAHNAELLTLCLSRVLEQAWRSNIGERGACRSFFAAEAAFRVRLAWQAQRPAAIAEHLAASETSDASPVKTTVLRPALLRFAAAACLMLGLLFWATHARASETLPVFTHDGRSFTNAAVRESNPVDVLLCDDAAGYVRIKRIDMPAVLKTRFPYDPEAAAEYERQKVAKARTQQEQARVSTLNALLRQESEVVQRIHRFERDLAALQRQLDVLNVSARGKKNSAARQEADRLREVKRDYIALVDQLRLQLQGIRERQAQYR